jgi:hypothetical protein
MSVSMNMRRKNPLFNGFVEGWQGGQFLLFNFVHTLINLSPPCHCRFADTIASGEIDVVKQTPVYFEGENTDGNRPRG